MARGSPAWLLLLASSILSARVQAIQSWAPPPTTASNSSNEIDTDAGSSGSGKFLLMSTPRKAEIAYVELPEDGSFDNGKELKPKILISTGLHHPQGLAVDRKRKILYVADPDTKRIVSYQLDMQGSSLRVVGEQRVVAQHAEARWVAVDEQGDIIFSDEGANKILKVNAAEAAAKHGTAHPVVIYSDRDSAQVSQPGGVAVDGFHIYWTNKHFGTKVGAVVRASETRPNPPFSAINIVALNAEKSYGICMAMGNIFFTNADRSLFGIKKKGGSVTEVSQALMKPRGCAWDGDGTVFVADRGANTVYAFPGNMPNPERVEMQKAVHFEDAFGLAVIGRSSRATWSTLALAGMMVFMPFM